MHHFSCTRKSESVVVWLRCCLRRPYGIVAISQTNVLSGIETLPHIWCSNDPRNKTLINNLVGKKVACVGLTMQSETSIVTPYEVAVEGVGLSVYDTPGLDDSRGDEHEVKDLHILRDILT